MSPRSLAVSALALALAAGLIARSLPAQGPNPRL
jgi:hypothetical protein